MWQWPPLSLLLSTFPLQVPCVPHLSFVSQYDLMSPISFLCPPSVFCNQNLSPTSRNSPLGPCTFPSYLNCVCFLCRYPVSSTTYLYPPCPLHFYMSPISSTYTLCPTTVPSDHTFPLYHHLSPNVPYLYLVAPHIPCTPTCP